MKNKVNFWSCAVKSFLPFLMVLLSSAGIAFIISLLFYVSLKAMFCMSLCFALFTAIFLIVLNAEMDRKNNERK